MSQLKTLKEAIVINAGPSRIWKVLTTAAYSRQYYYDLEIDSEWTQDSAIYWRKDGVIIKTGRVTGIIPGMFVEFEIFPAKDNPTLKIVSRYDLQTDVDGIKLTIVLPVSIDSESEFISHRQICRAMLQKIKWLAEYS
jgi:hypothetical protein